VTIVADARKQVKEANEANNVFKTFEQAKGKSGGAEYYGDNWGK
jgi:subtilase family serine protease